MVIVKREGDEVKYLSQVTLGLQFFHMCVGGGRFEISGIFHKGLGEGLVTCCGAAVHWGLRV